MCSDELGEGRARPVLRRIEDGHPADVHRRGGGLDGEEGGVEGGQSLGGHGGRLGSPTSGCQWSAVSRAALVGVAELGEELGEAVGVVVVGHVPGALEADELAAGHRLVGGVAVADRDDRVVLAPHDQRRQQGGEAEPVLRADALAAGLDHGPHGVQERLARARVVERLEAAAEHLDVAAGAQPDAPQQAADLAPEPEQPARGERGQHVVGARQRGGAQDEVHLAAEPAAGDEHEALRALGELVGELHRDAAAERVPDARSRARGRAP